MDVIEMTRKLGQAIQEDERYKAYMEACSINDTDVEIQNKIGEFNQLRSQLSVEMQKPDKDGEKITTNAPGLKYSARVENFRELIPIPAISIGSSALNAKFMEYTQLSANWSGRRPVNLMMIPRIMVHASPGITPKPGRLPRILPSKYRQKLMKIPEPNAT